jgi:hypothetical protein
MEERKKSGAEKAIDRAEARARDKASAAIAAWQPLRLAQLALENDGTDVSTNVEIDAVETLMRRWLDRGAA